MARKVLIVDRDQEMLDSLERELSLHKETFTVLKSQNSTDATLKFKEQFISLVVLELNITDAEGINLLTHIKATYTDIPVVVISDDKSAGMLSLVKEKGGTALVTKPFHADDLAKILLNLLQKEADGGIMHNVSPTVFLQLMEMESRTCTIRIIDKVSERGGILYFFEGELVDARINRIYGIDAAYIIFGWENVTIYIENDCPQKENVVNSPLQPIIMKAVTLKDHVDEENYAPPVADEIQPAQSSPAPAEPSPGKVTPAKKPPPKKVVKLTFMDKVRLLLKRELGARFILEDIYEDRGLERNIRTLSELQNFFEFGSLKVVYIQNGKETDRIILPAQAPTVVDVNTKGQEERIIKVLSSKLI